MPGLGEMLDEVPRELGKPRRPSRARPGTSPEGKPRVVSIVAIVSSGPSSDTLYRTVPGCHLPVDPIWQIKQFHVRG